ncbi:MAG: formate dehydrogenase accessory sulfurtransferase FdhD [Candidatus Hermodarchaeota archaeon]|nr:formate dehydrogenase accessory sulfurtransferase FdhD [Candidatus Hermodarchaeota archaeon]
MKSTRSISILKCMETHCEEIEDVVAHELGLRILLTDSMGEESFALVHTLPTEFDSLIIGLLFTSRLISSPGDVVQIRTRSQLAKVRLSDESAFRDKLNSIRATARIVMGICGPEEGALGTWRACDVPAIETSMKISPSIIRQAIQNLNNEMVLYRQTGGTHGAALVDTEGNVIKLAEDVGRHSAIDRVIGKALLDNMNLSNLILVCSGRLTGDLVLKAAVARIPLIASISAGVFSGIELADAAGVTLIGFVRGARMNVYTHPSRLVFSSV